MTRAFRWQFPLLASLLVAMVVLFGCGQFKSMGKLQRAVSKEFGITVTTIRTTNGVHLQLIFENADLKGRDLSKLSSEIAEFTRDNYDDFDKLETVSVIFGTKSQYGPVNVKSTDAKYSFSASELSKDKNKNQNRRHSE